ncbi:DUF4345 domain-containing protein [Nocardia sp. IBHARD005]|uniref:DUF4345 domain-containing protein n=1 Tax=Nocardia sp. IBHARD005 TaxID=3457765 RepID=UPI004059AFCF
MRKALQIWLVVFGVGSTLIALSHLFWGTATIIGGGEVNATIDSDLRFYSVLFAAFGIAYIWCAKDVETKAIPINLLGAIFFIGGFARFLSIAAEGLPHAFYIVMIPVELIVPVVNYYWIKAVQNEKEAVGT